MEEFWELLFYLDVVEEKGEKRREDKRREDTRREDKREERVREERRMYLDNTWV